MSNSQNQIDRRAKRFWIAFWATLGLLILLYTWAQTRIGKVVRTETGEVLLSGQYSRNWEQALPRLITDMEGYFSEADTAIVQQIDTQVDTAFAPVYRQIPKFADFHYSVTGEYTEIVAALAGQLSQNLQRILFEDTGFQARLANAEQQILKASQPIVATALKKTGAQIKSRMNFSEHDMAIISGVVSLSLNDAKKRFGERYATLRYVGTATGSAAAGALAAKLMGKKAATKIATKLAAKGAIKTVTIAGGAGTGALAGSWGGPVGATIGGIIGAIATWLATDKLVISIDEYMNRQQFERTLVQLLNDEKATIKAQLLAAYRKQIHSIAEHNRESLQKKVKTTLDLIRK